MRCGVPQLGLTTALELEAEAGKSRERRQGRRLQAERKARRGIWRTWRGDPVVYGTKHSTEPSAAAPLPSCKQRHKRTHWFCCRVAMSELLTVWRSFHYLVQVISWAPWACKANRKSHVNKLNCEMVNVFTPPSQTVQNGLKRQWWFEKFIELNFSNLSKTLLHFHLQMRACNVSYFIRHVGHPHTQISAVFTTPYRHSFGVAIL